MKIIVTTSLNPEGLVAHKYMHERAGDTIPINRKRKIGKPFIVRPPLGQNLRIKASAKAIEKNPFPLEKRPLENKSSEESQPKNPEISVKMEHMTRRFTIKEKLRIIDKFKELNNVTATTRWVQKEYRRSTFVRKSLTKMLAKENVYRAAVGTKKLERPYDQRQVCFSVWRRSLQSRSERREVWVSQ